MGRFKSKRITDYGGVNPGHSLQLAGNAVTGICTSCNKRQVVVRLAWFRAARPTCRHCGGLLEPSQRAQMNDRNLAVSERAMEKITCIFCPTVLRSGNMDGHCSVCTPKMKALEEYFFPVDITGVYCKSMVHTEVGWVFSGRIRLFRRSDLKYDKLVIAPRWKGRKV